MQPVILQVPSGGDSSLDQTTDEPIQQQSEHNPSSENALKVLEPSNKSIVSIEAARIFNVYNQLVCQTKILLNLHKIKEFLLSDHALQEIAKKSSIIERIDLLLSLKQKLRNTDADSVGNNNADDASSDSSCVTEQIQSISRNLCRSFHHNRELEKVIIMMLDQDSGKGNSFIDNLTKLKPLISERLRTLPSEEVQRERHLVRIQEKQANNATIQKRLEEQLRGAEEEKNNELAALNEDLRKLKSDLYQLEQFTEEQIRRTKTDIEKQNTSDSRNSEQRQKKTKAEINVTGLKHGKILIQHQEEEEKLRRKKSAIEKQIEDWIDKYDTEAGELQSQLDDETEQYDKLTAQHKELNEKFQILKIDYEKIMEERRIEHEKRERERIEIEEKTTAAEVIQAYFRSYKVRKAIKGKGKKGKGKGKKGK